MQIIEDQESAVLLVGRRREINAEAAAQTIRRAGMVCLFERSRAGPVRFAEG